MGKLTGRSAHLLSFDEIAQQLKVTGRADRNLQEIPVKAIVGSVGRYTDFTRTFLPRMDSDADRWARVKMADISGLPPIQVYKIGEAYFVMDGNHRVSIAIQQGWDTIPAFVTEFRTRVPLPADVQPDELILRAEYASFLEFTKLDRLRPEARLLVTLPGQYFRLEDHIEAYRFLLETESGQELSFDDAVTRWYDEAYLPIVQAIREQGILRHFPGRSETDFYIWIACHRAELRNELGWEIRPEVAVSQLAWQIEPDDSHAQRFVSRLAKRMRQLVVSDRHSQLPMDTSWSEAKLLERYSARLFAEVLVLVDVPADLAAARAVATSPALLQAQSIADREEAQVRGLCVLDEGASMAEEVREALVTAFGGSDPALSGQLHVERGEFVPQVVKRSQLNDLVIVPRNYPTAEKPAPVLTPTLGKLLAVCPRPLWIAPGQSGPVNKILLAYDGGEKARQALFVAAYLAEQWGVALTVVTVEAKGITKDALAYAEQYLAMHEIGATFLVSAGDPAEEIAQTAADKKCDLILVGGLVSDRHGRTGLDNALHALLAAASCPVLVCP